MFKKAIYILGGMGPQASNELMQVITKKAQLNYGAINNDDFPEVILHSVPIPDFLGDTKQKEIALEMLKDVVKALDPNKVCAFAIACNTVHIITDELKVETDVPFISMIDTVTDTLDTDIHDLPVVGTPSTIKSGLYTQSLLKKGVNAVLPDKAQLNVLESAIRSVIAGENNQKHKENVIEVISQMRKSDATPCILGCTELPLLFTSCERKGNNLISSLDVLADKVLACYYSQIVAMI